MSDSTLVIRQNSPSARSQYVVDVVFKEWMGLDIRWTEEGALEGACSLWQDDRCLAAWTANEWIQDASVRMPKFNGCHGSLRVRSLLPW